MKQIILGVKAAALGLLCATIFSFTSRPGGEGFEIYLNNKLLVQKFGKDINTVESLQLEPQFADAQLTVKYYHCGRAGKDRHITIRNAQNRVLKQWNFPDNNSSPAMNFNTGDIYSLAKGNTTLSLYYASSELPSGRLLASLVSVGNTAAKHAK